MLVIGSGELREPLGDKVDCPRCGQQHPVEFGEEVLQDGTKKPSGLLAFYRCGEKTYVAGIDGFALPHGR